MPRNSSGTYQQPANTAAVTNTAISSSAYNTLITDIGTELTNSLDRQGRSAMAAALPMGNNKITGMADPTVATDGATKNYTDNAVAAFFSTGDVKWTFKTVADAGWLMIADQTIGNAGSGAAYANTDVQALFTLLWNNISNTYAPVSGGRGVSATADWTGLKTMQLPLMLGRLLGAAGTGSGLTSRALGQNLGAETVTLNTNNLPPYTPVGSLTGTAQVGIGTSGVPNNNISHTGAQPTVDTLTSFGGGNIQNVVLNINNNTLAFAGNPQGGTSAAFGIMPPASFLNCMVKK